MPPVYEYLCPKCGKTHEAVRTVDERNNGPRCCGRKTKKQISHYHVAPLFNAYRVAGAERGKVIRSRGEHRDYLKKHGYVEVGNDPSYAPPPFDPDREAERKRETKEALEQLEHAPSDEAA